MSLKAIFAYMARFPDMSDAPSPARSAQSGQGWTEVFLNASEAERTTPAESLELGHSVVLLHSLSRVARESPVESHMRC